MREVSVRERHSLVSHWGEGQAQVMPLPTPQGLVLTLPLATTRRVTGWQRLAGRSAAC